jgi:TolB-like protein
LPKAAAADGFWAHVQDQKLIQWGLAYLGGSLAVAHGAELLGHAFHWPEVFWRIVVITLVIGLPIALTLAWYHGHRGLKQVGAGELMMISVLALIGALFFTVSLRPSAEHPVAAPVTAGLSSDTNAEANGTAPARSAITSDRSVLPNSVAVLPFKNLSPNEEDAYFAAGMHEEVLTQLAKLRNLSVISRTSVMRYVDTDLSVPEIARELKVGAVMEGSVRYAGDRVRITAQLIDADTDQHIWSDAYDRDLADIFAIQADIAMNIANALLAEFTPDEQARIERAPTQSTEAYALYLRALESNDHDGVVSLLREAIEIDPQFAMAYAELAAVYALGVINSDGFAALPAEERVELEALSRQYAEQAIQIEPSLGRAHYALAVPALVSWRWAEAEAAFEKGREVDPTDVPPQYAMLLSALGRHDEAITLAQRARELEPDNPNGGWYGYVLGWAGDYDAAAEVLQRLAATAPRYLTGRDWLAFMENARGNSDAAVVQIKFSEQLAADDRLVVFLPEWAYNYARAGRPEDARRIFDEMQRAAAMGARPGAGGWAMAYLAIGDQQRALEWLETAARKAADHEPDEGFFQLINLRMNVTNDPVLKQPEFVAVLDRIRGD